MDRRAVLAITLTLLLLSMLTLVFNIQPAKASGTIYIRADGSIEPSTANITSTDNVTYYFTDNNYDEIVVERDDIVVDGAGYTVQGTGATSFSRGVTLSFRNNVTLKNVEVTNFFTGITILGYSSNNVLTCNNASNNIHGITILGPSNNNVLTSNNASNNQDGIVLSVSSNNTLSCNTASNNDNGIYLYSSSDNTLPCNTASNNEYGIRLFRSSDNTLFHNNLIDNTFQADVADGYVNTWDDGYPSGGNYWSDYSSRYPTIGDEYQGETQDILGSDGIWDSPYVVDDFNQDNYPLVEPWSPVISATVDIDPDTLNLGSKGRWITTYIQLPEEYNVEDIDAATILLNETIQPVLDPKYEFVTNSSEYLVDHNEDGILERMVKFDKAEVMALLSVGEATLTITGVDGTKFEGSGSIRVILPSTGSGGCKGFKK